MANAKPATKRKRVRAPTVKSDPALYKLAEAIRELLGLGNHQGKVRLPLEEEEAIRLHRTHAEQPFACATPRTVAT